VDFARGAAEQSIASRFERQAALYAPRLAIKTLERAWTYDELNATANRVARRILAAAPSPAAPVALLFETGAAAVAAILAVLKTGRPYVPLDGAAPDGRLAWILRDSGATAIVTTARDARRAAGLSPAGVATVDIDAAATDAADGNLALATAADASACLLYTSGSTGAPKGVVQPHRSLLHWARTYTATVHITADDRLTLLHSWTAPSCLHHLLSSLLNGASLFPFDARTGTGDDLVQWLTRERITVWHSVPRLFRHTAPAIPVPGSLPSLRAVTLSGAPMAIGDVELYKRRLPSNSVLVHMIGTTETGWLRRYYIDQDTVTAGNTVPVGYAVEDTHVGVLCEDGLQAAHGQVGEIVVESRYLASGYWRRDDLTASRFTSREDAGLRLYRTGDLGRLEPDGCLFHLGRRDFQVKVRGHRVEPGEVERALLQHAGIRDAAVIGRPHDGDTRLTAYVVTTEGEGPDAPALRRFLAARLPEYMVPAVFVHLAALPYLATGKVDYGALPAAGTLLIGDATPFEPQSDLERRIAAVWKHVLHVTEVRGDANFFDAGGDSLLLAQVRARLQTLLQLEIPAVEMFRHPTIQALAAYLCGLSREREGAGQPASAADVRPGRHRLAQLARHRRRPAATDARRD
jgi:amino acid adenylation domain-containing protein